ncbi:hypothetical protein [Asaia bogorensis]|uniref:hypothetical protein n=1 Tax=Asaia bogorensis TaxID=91915 RepID=UPI00197CA41E|nr:hypothetical protein [Asaia bogorensis]
MLAETVTATLFAALDRPDLQSLSDHLVFDLSPRLNLPFRVSAGKITLGAMAFERPQVAPVLLRYALEWAFLLQILPREQQSLAALAAARVAALFHSLDCESHDLPIALEWLRDFAEPVPPSAARVAALWPELTQFCPEAAVSVRTPGRLLEQLKPFWSSIAPAEYLMADGGDERLAINPGTGLNRYGCSHRPRPWAVTFSSSTASSLSERGYLGAEEARRRFLEGCLDGVSATHMREGASLEVRARLAALYGLISAEQVVLAASGTDCELAVLALGLMRARGRPVRNILVAPDETGSGVPLAAQGRHFAEGTALGSAAEKAEFLDGFPETTEIAGIAIRNDDGSPRTAADIDEACRCLVERSIKEGYHVILHQLDMSKTGLVGPTRRVLDALARDWADHLTIVVDACQARLASERIRQMVQAGMLVMTTGSKFLTGPPFCGALLLPESFVAALQDFTLPQGLSAYFHRCEWPAMPSSTGLPDNGNIGLALRWQAALAESAAFADVPATRVIDILQQFEKHARKVIAAHPHLDLLPVPDLDRAACAEGISWDSVPTIFSFLVRDPACPERPLTLEKSRAVHRWLNADLSPCIPGAPLASLLCHLGQPVPVPHPALGGELAGALRLCAGARLVSGEPSHAGFTDPVRLAREFADVCRALDKISLILVHLDVLEITNPVPRYAPHSHSL